MRQHLIGVLCVVSAFMVLSSCGGGPNTPTVTVTSITVNSTSGFIVVGGTETFTATANMSNGTTQAVTGGTWGSDTITVATVGSTTGLVTTVRSGDVTIFVDSQGVRGSKRITVAPDYRGTWSGSYVVNTCAQTGGFVSANLCASTLAVGAVLPIAFLNLTQTGGTVSGQTALGAIVSNQFSTVAVSGGGLTFPATAVFGTTTIAQAWQINSATAGQLTGTNTQTWTDPTVGGSMIVATTLQTTTKTSASPLGVRWDNPRGSLSDIAEAIRRVR